MNYVYLDWNVFNKIENLETLQGNEKEVYSTIQKLICSGQIITPYSNAHINDLVRGYEKNPSYIQSHLSTLRRLTNNLCIVQYWGQKQTVWHYRDVADFFYSAIEEVDVTGNSFSDLMDWDDSGLWNLQLSLLRMQRLPENFKDLNKANPVFNLIFPKSMTEMNLLALCEDLFDFAKNSKKDFTIYKTLRAYVNQSRQKFKEQPKVYREIDKSMAGVPQHLNFDEQWEKYSQKSKTSENPAFQRITDVYYKIDFKGYKSDEKFANLIDDSLHVFYGAHCSYFITIDDKCYYKASETYKELKLNSKALKPQEFISILST